MSRRLSLADTVGSRPVFLLEIRWCGEIYRFSSEPIDVEMDSGRWLPFMGGLGEIEYVDSIEEESAEQASVPIEVVFPVNVAQRQRQGFPLHLATGELSMVLAVGAPGRAESLQRYEERFLLLSGSLTSPLWGDPGKSVGWAAFSLEEAPFTETPLLDPSWVISAQTWPTHDERHTGKSYPWVFGAPGYWQDASGVMQTTPATPGYLVSTVSLQKYLLIAAGPVMAGSVTVFDADNDASAVYPVQQRVDGLGQICSYCDISMVSDSFASDSSEYWIGWHSGGGAPSPYRAGALERADELVRHLVTRARGGLDQGAWESVTRLFRRVTLAGYVNDPTAQIWPWLRDELLPLLPIRPRRSARGLGVIPLLPTRPLAQLPQLSTGDGDLVLISAEQDLRALPDIVNDVSLGLAISKGDAPQAWRRLSGDPTVADRVPDNAAEASRGLYGSRVGPSMETAYLYSIASADRVLSWMVRLAGFVPTAATVWAHPRLGWIEAGDEFALICADLSIPTARRVRVATRRWSAARRGWVWGLEIQADGLEQLLE